MDGGLLWGVVEEGVEELVKSGGQWALAVCLWSAWESDNSPVLDVVAHLMQDFRLLAELALLLFGVLEVLTVLGILCCVIGADPSRAADVVDHFLGRLLDLRHDLDRGRAVANDADSLSVPVAVFVPSGCLARFRYVKRDDSKFLTIWHCGVVLL